MAKGKSKSKKSRRAGQHHLAAFKLRGQRKAISDKQDVCEFLEDVRAGAVTVGEQTFVRRSWLSEHGHELAEELGYEQTDAAVEAMENEGLLQVYEDAELDTEIEKARRDLEALRSQLGA